MEIFSVSKLNVACNLCRKKVLRAKSNRNSKGSDSTKKRAIKRQKINKLDAKKPKKPPTAFFYFLYVIFPFYIVNYLILVFFLVPH